MTSFGPTLALVIGASAAPVAAAATEVQVIVTNVGHAEGIVRATLCMADNWLQPICGPTAFVPAQPGLVVIDVPDVPPGIYGIIVHHDTNEDGTVNQDMFGRPTEGVGFSRDAPIRFAPPLFEDAELDISGDLVVAEVNLLFEPE